MQNFASGEAKFCHPFEALGFAPWRLCVKKPVRVFGVVRGFRLRSLRRDKKILCALCVLYG
jgi:hypothetical protein